ncbi:MAG: hypothetical protein JSW68_07450, partial [Burkholderiales bacterium]
IRRIVARAPAHLAPGGWLLLEHGCEQAGPVRALLAGAGGRDIGSWTDLAGLDRVSGARFGSSDGGANGGAPDSGSRHR